MVEPPGAGPEVNAGLAVAVSAMVCGEPGASSVIDKLAVRCPGPSGLKTREIVQLAAAETGDLQLLVSMKSEGFVPARDTAEICRIPVPEFVTVSVCAAPDVPSVIVGKEGSAGEMEIPMPVAAPVPLRASVCGESGALSVNVRVAERKPGACGVNVTFTVHAELTAMGELHVGLEEL